MRMHFVLLLLLAMLAMPLGSAVAAEQAGEPKKREAAATDSAKLERYLRRQNAWPASFQVTVGPFKPSPAAGVLETTVEVSHPGGKRKFSYLVSADGKYLVQGSLSALNADPFEATRAKIDLQNAPVLGSPLAQVTVVEYSDFQCSYCRASASILKDQLLKKFPSQVRLVFKDFPLQQRHPWAVPAAVLGRCIHKNDAGSFWPYHDWVFANQTQLTPENFKEKALAFATEQGMDAGQLGVCMDQAEARAEVDRAVAEGQAVGVSGTPTLFINGRRMVGNQSADRLRRVVEAELEYLDSR
jgi:protein-disulfide isomerase